MACGQVHEEVLRLLMVATDRIGVPKLAEYLQAALANSKKSRRCVCLSQRLPLLSELAAIVG